MQVSTRSRCGTYQKKWKELKAEIYGFPHLLRNECTLDNLERMLAIIVEYEKISEFARPDRALTDRIFTRINAIGRKMNVPWFSSPLFKRLDLIVE